jgi:hypothetical protein
LRRDRVVSVIKWPIYAVLIAACLSASVGLWSLVVWLIIKTVQVLQ